DRRQVAELGDGPVGDDQDVGRARRDDCRVGGEARLQPAVGAVEGERDVVVDDVRGDGGRGRDGQDVGGDAEAADGVEGDGAGLAGEDLGRVRLREGDDRHVALVAEQGHEGAAAGGGGAAAGGGEKGRAAGRLGAGAGVGGGDTVAGLVGGDPGLVGEVVGRGRVLVVGDLQLLGVDVVLVGANR